MKSTGAKQVMGNRTGMQTSPELAEEVDIEVDGVGEEHIEIAVGERPLQRGGKFGDRIFRGIARRLIEELAGYPIEWPIGRQGIGFLFSVT